VAAPKRIQQQREQDLLFIERLYVRGISQREIATELGKVRPYTVSHKTIGRDIHTILDRWRQEMLHDVDQLKAAELARLNRLEREAWDAWDRSCTFREKTLTEQKTFKETEELREQQTREGLIGDPRYLATIQWCIAKRCEILGLNAPARVEQTVTTTLADLVRSVSEKEKHDANTPKSQ